MKMQELALSAAELAELKGWAFVSAVSLARSLSIHSVTVSRSASIKDILSAARKVVTADCMRYPRASIEMRVEPLDHNQRGRVLHALAREETL